jgi:hypothetical protein
MAQPRRLGGARPFLHHLTQLLGVKESLLPSYTRIAAWLTASDLTSYTSLSERIISVLETRARENGITRRFIFYTPRQMLLERSCQGGWNGSVMWHAWGRREMRIRVCLVGKVEEKWPLRRGACELVHADLVQLLSKEMAFCGYGDEHSNSLTYPKFQSNCGYHPVKEGYDLWS